MVPPDELQTEAVRCCPARRLKHSAGYRVNGLHQDALMQVPDTPAVPPEESPDFESEPVQPVSLAPGQRFDPVRLLSRGWVVALGC